MKTSRFVTSPAALALLLSAAAPLARSATVTWNGPTTGTSAWDLAATSNWSNGQWINANNDTASFAGSADYQVTIAAGVAISAAGISSTNTSTTTISGGAGATLTLAGATPTISGTGNTKLNLALGGSNGLTKLGNGTLYFSAASTYSGNTTLSGGQITLQVANALPTATKLTITSGNFSLQGFSQTLSGLAGSAGNVRTTNGSTAKLTINGSTTDTFAGSVSDGATAGVALSFERAGTGTSNLNGTNSYRGSTTVSGGVLSFGSNLTASNSVTVNGGTLSSSIASVTLGAGAVSMSSGAISPGGVSVGKFIVAADKSFSATGGTLAFDLGSSFDQIAGSGTGTFSLSNTSLALTLGAGFNYGSTYNLFQGFSGGSVSSLAITGYDTANYIAVLGDGTTGPLGMLSFTTVAVPEPSSCALLLGAAALGFVATRRRASRR